MVSIDILKASDGTGEAPRATVTSLRSVSGTIIEVDTISNWPSTFVATTGTLLTNQTLDPATIQVFKGHVSGSDIVIDTFAPGYTDLGNSVGDVVVVKPSTLWADLLVEALRVSLNDLGEIDVDEITVDTITARSAAGVVVNGLKIDEEYKKGWITNTLPAVNSVTALGNNSYSMVFASTVAPYLNPGTRGRSTRTVAAPTQCTSLNGTTQYWVKTSPNKLTFTDDFVVSAWVKLNSYGTNSVIVSRYNGTSGWNFYVDTSGRLNMTGFNAGAANFSLVQSYQSVPLNKWVHVAAQLDMSSFTATTTTSYIMIDGVDVPATVSRGGTNPTALVQAGNLEIGSQNSGTNLFPGKIAQVAIYNAKVTQATILASRDRSLSGSETSLASAYSFNGVATDLMTTTPNDLSVGGGSATATNADSPFGGQADGTISSTLDYFITQSVSTTTAIVQVPEGCTIPTTGGVSAVAYSNIKAPYGMPVSRIKWTIELDLRILFSLGTIARNVYTQVTGVALKLPVGEFAIRGSFAPQIDQNGTGYTAVEASISTSVGTTTIVPGTAVIVGSNNASAGTSIGVTTPINAQVTNAAATTYIMQARPHNSNAAASNTLFILGDRSPAAIYAENAYL